MLYDLLMSIAGLIVLLGGWLLFQYWVRKRSPEIPPDCDLWEGRIGCSHCELAETCPLKKLYHSA